MGKHEISICNVVKVLQLSGAKGKCVVKQEKETAYHGYFVQAKGMLTLYVQCNEKMKDRADMLAMWLGKACPNTTLFLSIIN